MSASVDMQIQMRRNIDEMHASVGDLKSWTSEIAKRDRSLRGKGERVEAGSAQAEAEALARAEEEEEEREIAAAKEELRRLAGEDAARRGDFKARRRAGYLQRLIRL